MVQSIVLQLLSMASRLTALGLGYLALDRAGSSLSTGERQRVQLARAVRNRTTGVLYVLDEPSIGLHPANTAGLLGLLTDLLADGNSVLVVDHDVQVLREADHLIEIGPRAGRGGGTVIAQGSVEQIEQDPRSLLGPYLAGTAEIVVRERLDAATIAVHHAIRMRTAPLRTVHSLDVTIPTGCLTAVTGASGSGKTTMVLESFVPALTDTLRGRRLRAQVRELDADGVGRVHAIDASPIGANVRSTVSTYTGSHDDLRRPVPGTDRSVSSPELMSMAVGEAK